ncbi:MAG: metal-dependent hydrolase [Deltaproteobacteria bacterium]|nr:metal-dependent hydrolase [Deltaproteobacteria bacterium]
MRDAPTHLSTAPERHPTVPRPEITPRRPGLRFRDVPRYWFGGNAVGTHAANALNLLFPAGERFFVRSVHAYLDRLDPERDAVLRAEVRAFVAQEARHGAEHEHFFEALEAQGFAVRPLLDLFERIAFGWIEPNAPPVLRLSATAALEHFTATFARLALTQSLLDNAHPTMRALLRWHAAEEIEHRAVAFDVLQHVDPRLRTRIAGLGVAVLTLFPFWTAFHAALLWQDRDNLSLKRVRAEKTVAVEATRNRQRATREALLRYLARDFHPLEEDTTPLAREYFARNPVPAG